MSCLATLTPPGWQGPADGVPCCWATMDGDWGDCTCWAPIYDPPLDARQRPHRTDGTVGSLCAGWDARRRAWAAAPADRDLPSLAHASTLWEAP